MPFLACRRQNWSLRTRALEPSVGVRWLFPPRGCKHSFGQDTDRWRNHSPPRAQGIGWLLPQPPWRPGFRHVGRSGWTTGKGKGMGGGRAFRPDTATAWGEPPLSSGSRVLPEGRGGWTVRH